MTIETAYSVLGAEIAGALMAGGFISALADLQVDPSDDLDLGDDPDVVETIAALVKLETPQVVRTMLGNPPRFVVERLARLELALASPDPDWRSRTMSAALLACAALPQRVPTLGGHAERFMLTGREDDNLPPNGLKTFLMFTLRVRSGDPLGLTP